MSAKPKRDAAAMQMIIFNYLNTHSSMRTYARPSQIRAAAKQMQRSGNIPVYVAAALRHGAAEAAK